MQATDLSCIIAVFLITLKNGALLVANGSCSNELSTVGREFLFGLIGDYRADNVAINIASETPGRIYVNAPAVGINRHYLINSATKEIILTSQIIQTSNTTVENKAVYIISDTDISVNVVVSGDHSYGGFLVFPLQQTLRNVSFLVASFPDVISSSYPSEIQLIASRNSTQISIELPDDLTGIYIQNNSMHLTLDEHQAYQLQSVYDLTGTRIKSSAPISVITGKKLAHIDSVIFSGYIIDQMPPVDFLGTQFIVPPLETRIGYFIKIIAPENHISVKLHNRTGTYSFMIYRGFVQTILMNNSEPVFISSNRPVMVAQYGIASKGGYMMMIVPSISNYMDRYNFLIPSLISPFSNFLCVISLTTNVSDILVDSQPLSSISVKTSYIRTVAGNFTISVVKLLPGRHTVASKTGTTTFGALLYGFHSYHGYTGGGYGFPLGMRAQGCSTSPTTHTSSGTASSTVSVGPNSPTTTTPMPVTATSVETHSTKSHLNPVLNGTGPYCFNCPEVSHLYLCNKVTRCKSTEVCSIASFRTSSGFVKYRTGCMEEGICERLRTTRDAQPVDCVECCESNFCNNHGCDGQGLPDIHSRGPLCYDCPHVESVEECDTVTLCHRGQCIPTKRSTPVCQTCCDSDFCNINCTKTPSGPIIG